MALLEAYSWTALRTLLQNSAKSLKIFAFSANGVLSLNSLFFLLFFITGAHTQLPVFLRNTIMAFLVATLVARIILLLILLPEDLFRLGWLGVQKVRGHAGAELMGRRKFISLIAISLAALPFAAFLYGWLYERFRLQTVRIRIFDPALPASFRGYKIVQLSDLHAGSFESDRFMRRMVEEVNKLKPDLIVFTGDLVNNTVDEIYPHVTTLSALKAADGVISVLGNHDYGDYIAWPSAAAKEENLRAIQKIQADMGWTLLNNSHIQINRGQGKMIVAGTENWGARAGFPKLGNLDKALKGVGASDFVILLSHDPSHWRAKVLNHPVHVHLMLSGHTHGMQMGIKTPTIKWSPSQYIYPEWSGLYKEGEKKLYVNTGLGSLGYPGRLGIIPEITLIELQG